MSFDFLVKRFFIGLGAVSLYRSGLNGCIDTLLPDLY